MNRNDRAAAVALLSGGLDSTVSIGLSAERFALTEAIFFDYSQAAAEKERAAAAAIAEAYGMTLRVVSLPWLGRASSSGLTGGDIPDYKAGEGAAASRAVWVENRNGLFINIAAVFAAPAGSAASADLATSPGPDPLSRSGPPAGPAPVSPSAGTAGLNASSGQVGPVRIVTGFNSEEAATFPDNSKDFIEAVNASLAISAGFPVRVEAPTVEMDKREIVREGLRLAIPWESLWSCYHGGETMCGRCESCYRLKRAVAGTGAVGKIVFAE